MANVRGITTRGTPLRMAMLLGAGLLAMMGATLAWRAQSVATGPLTDDTVVATLQAGARRYPDALRSALAAARASPADAGLARNAARALIDEGRATGDSRIVGAALGLLRPFLDAGPSAETLLLAATARQYQHDFTGALLLLNRAMALAPGDIGAILSRATIQTVQGRFDLALADCRRLFALGRPDLGFVCQASALTLTADAPAIYDRLAALLTAPGLLDPVLSSVATGLMGEIAGLQGWTGKARLHLSAALVLNPGDVRLRMMLADLMLDTGDAAAVLPLLRDAPDVDGVLLRRAIAASRTQDRGALDAAQPELDRRVRQNIALALNAHAREETRYLLTLRHEPELALSRAKANWALQHEIEDAQLLIDAAVAADRPSAAQPVLDWIAAQSVAVPTLRIPPSVRQAGQ